MAFPLATVLTAAPGLISAAADVIRIIRQRKKSEPEAPVDENKINELVNLIEQQALVIEELALNNRNMALAVRNNRILSAVAIVIAISTLGFVIL